MSKHSKENGPTFIARQQSRHPEMILAVPAERRVEQQGVERIRGGCWVCCGGSVWVCSAQGDGDDEKARAQQEQRKAEEASLGSSRLGLSPKPPQSRQGAEATASQAQSPRKTHPTTTAQTQGAEVAASQAESSRKTHPTVQTLTPGLAPPQGVPQISPLPPMTPFTAGVPQQSPAARRPVTSLPQDSQQLRIPQTTKPDRRASTTATPGQRRPSSSATPPHDQRRKATLSMPTNPRAPQ